MPAKTPSPDSTACHPIGVTVRRTGLSQHVLRVWEKRYQAVKPVRTDSNRRLYSDDDVVRLNLLKNLVDEGHRIGQIAALSTDELKDLVEVTKKNNSVTEEGGRARTESIARDAVTEAFERILELDAEGLEAALSQAAVQLGVSGTLHAVIVPLVIQVGEDWAEGRLLVAQEHVASAVIRDFLGSNTKPFASPSGAPELFVATPLGQLHELGAVLVSAAARIAGWKVTFLGASMPATDIAAAVEIRSPRALAISLVYPYAAPEIAAEIRQLKSLIPKEVALLFGGRAAGSYSDAIDQAGGQILGNLRDLRRLLDQLSTQR